jgi:drug/metabolite transporter (DMT)-like permease
MTLLLGWLVLSESMSLLQLAGGQKYEHYGA